MQEKSCLLSNTYLEHTVPPVVGTLGVLDVVHIVVGNDQGVDEVADIVLLADSDQAVAVEFIVLLNLHSTFKYLFG